MAVVRVQSFQNNQKLEKKACYGKPSSGSEGNLVGESATSAASTQLPPERERSGEDPALEKKTPRS